MYRAQVVVTIDTEEDNWGSFAETGATVRNIEHLPELQDRLSRFGARPTYLVNRPPLVSARSVEILGALAALPGVEIGAHCHPWNTPPSTGEGPERSMMCALPQERNRAKIAEVTERLREQLGVQPTSFRTGRWGFGPTVSAGLASLGYVVDASVTPFIDWRSEGGPDYSDARRHPYRFDPARPFTPDPHGSMVEIPTTVGFLGRWQEARSAVRRLAERDSLRGLRLIPVLEKAGLVRRRWLSPEQSSLQDILKLAEACLGAGVPVLDLSFHSCTLLPGATPFVRDENDLRRFLDTIEEFLRFTRESGAVFRNLSEVGASIRAASPD
jgi:hypothetical protein